MGDKAPARLLPFLDKIKLESSDGEALQPLQRLWEEMVYPPSMMQAGVPIHYKVLSCKHVWKCWLKGL